MDHSEISQNTYFPGRVSVPVRSSHLDLLVLDRLGPAFLKKEKSSLTVQETSTLLGTICNRRRFLESQILDLERDIQTLRKLQKLGEDPIPNLETLRTALPEILREHRELLERYNTLRQEIGRRVSTRMAFRIFLGALRNKLLGWSRNLERNAHP